MPSWRSGMHRSPIPDHAANACRAALTMLSDLEVINARRQSIECQTDCHRYRSQHRRMLCREFRLDTALRLLGDRQRRQSRVTFRRSHEVLRTAHRRRTSDRRGSAGFRVGRDRSDQRQGLRAACQIFALLGDRKLPRYVRIPGRGALRQSAMLEAFRSRQFDLAERRIAALRQIADPKFARLWDIYDDRIQGYQRQPPPDSWDGRAVAEFK